jgi:predicted nuclease with TOPRIM domain
MEKGMESAASALLNIVRTGKKRCSFNSPSLKECADEILKLHQNIRDEAISHLTEYGQVCDEVGRLTKENDELKKQLKHYTDLYKPYDPDNDF